VQLISESLGAVNIAELPPLSLLSLSNYQLPPQTLLPIRHFVIHTYSLHAPSLPRSTFTYFTSLVTLQLTRLIYSFSCLPETLAQLRDPQLILQPNLQPNLQLLCLQRLSIRLLSQGKLQHLRNASKCRQTR
jgi:hypothetical protein